MEKQLAKVSLRKNMNGIIAISKRALKTMGFGLCVLLASCGQRDPALQPKFSHNPKEVERFDDSTVFPYQADKERSDMISSAADLISIGETGDSVFEKLGAPDEIDVLARPFEPATGWSWKYYIRKDYGATSDRVLGIVFDAEGRVNRIKPASQPDFNLNDE